MPTGWALYSTQTRAHCRHQHSMHGGKTGARTKTDAEGWAKKEVLRGGSALSSKRAERRRERGRERREGEEGGRGGRERRERGESRRPLALPVGRHGHDGGVQWGRGGRTALQRSALRAVTSPVYPLRDKFAECTTASVVHHGLCCARSAMAGVSLV